MLFTNLNFHDDLRRLYSWNICNGMIADACKTKCLLFNGSAKISTTQHEVLENVSSDKDLGVYISNDLKWGFHVTSKLCIARQCFFSLKAKMPFNTPSHVKLHLYRSLVLSVLLYGFPAWYPDVSMLKKLENFQRSCFLWIFGRKSSYLKQLKDNNFLPLCYQLEYITFSFLSQLMLDKYNYDHSQYVVFQEPSRCLRGSSTNVLQLKNHHKHASISFFGRSVLIANYLFRNKIIDGFGSSNKKALKSYLMRKTFDPEITCTFFICCVCNSCKLIKSLC